MSWLRRLFYGKAKPCPMKTEVFNGHGELVAAFPGLGSFWSPEGGPYTRKVYWSDGSVKEGHVG